MPSKNLPAVQHHPPHRFGWLRRGELPHGPYEEIWELPDGKLYTHDTRKGDLMINRTTRRPTGDDKA